jgi:NTE family protein
VPEQSTDRATTPPERIALVLAGGKSLGAFEAGAYEALHEAGLRPGWIIGSSIGAVNGALIAGNPVDRRIAALRGFWSKAALPTPVALAGLGASGECARRAAAEMQAIAFGSPAVFAPNPLAWWAGFCWPAPHKALGFYDLAPLRRSLQEFVDFDLLNSGEVRLTAVATDLHTGEEVLFDTENAQVGPEHIVASGAMLTDFPPVEIDGRFFVDGGLSSNLPADVVQRQVKEDTLLFAIDLFSGQGDRHRNVLETIARREELLMFAQTRHLMMAQDREDALRLALTELLDLLPANVRDHPQARTAASQANHGEVRLIRLAFPSADEVGINLYDWSDRTLTMRWQAGEHAARQALDALAAAETRSPTESSSYWWREHDAKATR